MIRTRHVRLESAFSNVETEGQALIDIPEGMKPTYYRKYAYMKAEREGLHITTHFRETNGKTQLLLLKRS